MTDNWTSTEFLQKASHLILVSVMRFTLASLKVTWEMQFLNLSVYIRISHFFLNFGDFIRYASFVVATT